MRWNLLSFAFVSKPFLILDLLNFSPATWRWLSSTPHPGKAFWLPRRYIFGCWDSWQPSCRKSCLCWWWDIRQPQVPKPSCSHAGRWSRPTNIPKFRLCVVVHRRPADTCGCRAPRRCPSFLCRLLRLIEHLPTVVKKPFRNLPTGTEWWQSPQVKNENTLSAFWLAVRDVWAFSGFNFQLTFSICWIREGLFD